MRTQESDQMHNKILSAMVDELVKRGHRIHGVDHIETNYPKPDKINGSIPDIVSNNGVQLHITEVETCDSLELSTTKEQIEAFSNTNAKFNLVVPKVCSIEANKLKPLARNGNMEIWHYG